MITKERIIYEYKKCIPVKILCNELLTEFELLILYVRNLKYDELPNNQIMKDLLKRIIINNNQKFEEGEFKFILEKKFVDILEEKNEIKKTKLAELKSDLLKGLVWTWKNLLKI